MEKVEGLSVVIPVFNAEATLPDLLASLVSIIPTLATAHEIILVNDGSRDRSWIIIESLAQQNPSIRGINLARNYGQHNATLTGIRAARYGHIVTMDSDGQHPPEAIGALLVALRQGYDLVYGYSHKPHHGEWRDKVTVTLRWIFEHGGVFPHCTKINSFRAMNAFLRDALTGCNGPDVGLEGMIRWCTDRIGYVEVEHRPRQGGTSSNSVRQLTRMIVDITMSHSMLFIYVIAVAGLSLLAGGLLGLILAHTVSGWVMSGICACAGAIMVSLAWVGEYVARHYQLAQGKPQVIVRAQTGHPV